MVTSLPLTQAATVTSSLLTLMTFVQEIRSANSVNAYHKVINYLNLKKSVLDSKYLPQDDVNYGPSICHDHPSSDIVTVMFRLRL